MSKLLGALQGKGFFVMSSSSALLHEQLLKDVEQHLQQAIVSAEKAAMTKEELMALLSLLMEVDDE